ncbi:hypothetical protein OXX59_009112, partial [Metschnikowia pulcherrima]
MGKEDKKKVKKQKLMDSVAEQVAEQAEESYNQHHREDTPETLQTHDNGEFAGLTRYKTTAKDAQRLESGKINPFTGRE